MRERSKMLLILALPHSDTTQKLDELTGDYKQRLSQESVLRVTGWACVAF